MAVDDAHVHVFCDGFECSNESDPITLTSLAGWRCWDERNVDKELERMGWKVEDGKYLCDQCVENQEDSNDH